VTLKNAWASARPSDLPIGELLKQVFTSTILSQCDFAAKSTRKLLAGPCQILQHLQAVRKFFMMELELAFVSFTQTLFTQVRN